MGGLPLRRRHAGIVSIRPFFVCHRACRLPLGAPASMSPCDSLHSLVGHCMYNRLTTSAPLWTNSRQAKFHIRHVTVQSCAEGVHAAAHLRHSHQGAGVTTGLGRPATSFWVRCTCSLMETVLLHFLSRRNKYSSLRTALLPAAVHLRPCTLIPSSR